MPTSIEEDKAAMRQKDTAPEWWDGTSDAQSLEHPRKRDLNATITGDPWKPVHGSPKKIGGVACLRGTKPTRRSKN
jgi:hypothetical protein